MIGVRAAAAGPQSVQSRGADAGCEIAVRRTADGNPGQRRQAQVAGEFLATSEQRRGCRCIQRGAIRATGYGHPGLGQRR